MNIVSVTDFTGYYYHVSCMFRYTHDRVSFPQLFPYYWLFAMIAILFEVILQYYQFHNVLGKSVTTP